MAARRAPLDRLVDLAVAVPTCTLAAARRAVPLAARIGTLGTARVVGRVSEAVAQVRTADTGDDVAAEAAETATVGEPPEHDDRLAESIASDELPIDGYDDLAARQVVDRLGALDRADLGRVEVYEREHRNRSTVLGKIAQLTA